MTTTVKISELPAGQAISPISGTLPVDGVVIGGVTPEAGHFTTLEATGHTTFEGVTSTGATGTAKIVYSNTPTLVSPLLGTPTSGVLTNCTGTASGLTAGTVTTNANLTGAVTSSGNATSLGSFTSANLATALTDETGTGVAVFATSPTLVTPNIGAATGASLTITGATGTLTLKQGANGKTGTFVLNGVTPVTVNNTSITANSGINFTLKTVGGTVGAYPAIQTITPTTGFTVAGTVGDTSTYKYDIIESAA
jgi:hypothetical protein